MGFIIWVFIGNLANFLDLVLGTNFDGPAFGGTGGEGGISPIPFSMVSGIGKGRIPPRVMISSSGRMLSSSSLSSSGLESLSPDTERKLLDFAILREDNGGIDGKLAGPVFAIGASFASADAPFCRGERHGKSLGARVDGFATERGGGGDFFAFLSRVGVKSRGNAVGCLARRFGRVSVSCGVSDVRD
jgi:hypothetical protein